MRRHTLQGKRALVTELLRILEDGKWHPTWKLVEATRHLIRPEVAVRAKKTDIEREARRKGYTPPQWTLEEYLDAGVYQIVGHALSRLTERRGRGPMGERRIDREKRATLLKNHMLYNREKKAKMGSKPESSSESPGNHG